MASTGGADLPESLILQIVHQALDARLGAGVSLPGVGGGGGGASGVTPTSGMSTSMPSLPPPAAQTAPSMQSGADAGTPAGGPVFASAATQAINPQAAMGPVANKFMRPAVVTPPMGPQPSEFFSELRSYAEGESVAGGYSDFGPYSNPRMAPPAFLRAHGPGVQFARLDMADRRRQQAEEDARAEAENERMQQEARARGIASRQAGQAMMAASYMTGIGHSMMAVTPSADARLGSSLGMGAAQMGVMTANPYLAAGGALFGGAMSIVGGAQDFAYQKLVEQAGLERPRYLGATMGVDLSSKGRLATEGRNLGFRDAETAYMLSQYASSVGVADMSGMENPLRYQTMGVGLGAQAFYMQSAAVGGGGSQNLAEAQKGLGGLIGIGFQSGLRGDRLQELVTRIAGILEGFKEKGLTLDREGTNQFIADAMASGISGVRAAKGMQAMQGEASSLSERLMSPYRQLGQAALMSYVGQRAGSDLEAAEMAEELEQDPQRLYGALRSQGLSGDALDRYFSALTGNTREGKQYAKGLSRGQVQEMPKIEFMGIDLLGGAGMPGSRMLAEADAKVSQKVQEDFISALKGFTEVMARQGARNAGLGTSVASRGIMAASGALQQGIMEGSALGAAGTVVAPGLGTAIGSAGGFLHGVYDYLFGE